MKLITISIIAALLAGTATSQESSIKSEFSAKHGALYLQAETALLQHKNTDQAETLAEKLLSLELSKYERSATLVLLAGIRDAQNDNSGTADALDQLLSVDTSMGWQRRQSIHRKIGHLYMQEFERSRAYDHAIATLTAFAEFEGLGGKLTSEESRRLEGLISQMP